jgi:hypothetical protein
MKGVVQFLERDVVPALQEPLRFHARVAANLLKIIEREWELEPEHLCQERDRLIELLGDNTLALDLSGALTSQVSELNERLSREIRTGRADRSPHREQIMDHVRKTLTETLEITNPRVVSKKSTSKNP